MLPESFLVYIRERQLINSRDKLLVAVSGGLDSVVLTDLVSRVPYPFAIAHCNFGLRGHESDEDEEFVRRLAQSYRADFFVQQFNTKYYAEQEGVSTQMAARNLRYTWLEKIRQTEGFTKLVTAHHLSDSLETALINLTRGTGVRGLRGIRAVSGNVVRPLLSTTRDEIEVYARKQHLSWREDSSNLEDVYTRNYIRHQIIPLLKKVNPGLEHTFAMTSRRLRDADSLITERAELIMRDYAVRQGSDWFIARRAFKKENLAVAEEIFRPFGLNVHQVTDLLTGMRQEGTRLFLSPTHRVNVDRKNIIISPLDNETTPKVEIPWPSQSVSHPLGVFNLVQSENTVDIHRGPEAVTLDFDRLEFPLIVRRWEEGDSFQPLGMRGKKKVSDFMIDAKIPLNLKERVCVMESGGQIVWVVGYRLDDRYKVTPATERVLHISLEHDQSV